MTQPPRGFESQDPAETPGAQYPAPAASPSGSTLQGNDAGRAAERAPERPDHSPEPRRVTRTGMVWTAVAGALVVLILLIVFILQNQVYVQVQFFGLQGSVPLGVALFIAAVGGGVLVAVAGAARIIQLRRAAHHQRRSLEGNKTRTRR